MNSLDKMKEDKDCFEFIVRRLPAVYDSKPSMVADDQGVYYSDILKNYWHVWQAAIAYANSKHSAILEDYDRLAKLCEKQAEEIATTKFHYEESFKRESKYRDELSAARATIAMLRWEIEKCLTHIHPVNRPSTAVIAHRNTQAAVDAFMAEHDAKLLAIAKEAAVELAEDWSGYVQEDNAPTTNKQHMRDRFDATVAELRASANRKDE